jgi:hypothetical protein
MSAVTAAEKALLRAIKRAADEGVADDALAFARALKEVRGGEEPEVSTQAVGFTHTPAADDDYYEERLR